MRTKIVINPQYEYLREFIEKLPTDFDGQGEIIYDGRNSIKVIRTANISLNVKFFKVPNLINKIIYGNFRPSKARRSFEYANILLKNGINTPTPIAYIEQKRAFLFHKSFYLSIQEDFDGLMREFKTGKLEGREQLLTQFAQFTANMHNKEILHLDYSPGNILHKKANNNYSFYLVDLNRMFFGSISMEEGCKSLRRLWGSHEMISFIATEYAKARHFDVDKCRRLTLIYHEQFWKEFSKRHKDKKPYIAE